MINQGDEVWGGKRLNGDYTKPAESGGYAQTNSDEPQAWVKAATQAIGYTHQPRGPRLTC